MSHSPWEETDLESSLRELSAVVMLIDHAGRVRFCNRPLRNLAVEDVVGRTLLELTPPIHRDEIAARLADVFAGREGRSSEEQWLLGEGGGRRWYENTFIPLRRGRRVLAAMLVSHEITDRKRHELRLAKMHEQLEYAQQLAHVGSWSWEVGRQRVSWSHELYRTFGVEPGRGMTYARYLEHVHPDDRQRVRGLIGQAAEDLHPREFEHRIVRASGEERLVQCRIFVSSKADHRLWMYGTARDITDQRRQELERERLYHRAETAIRARDEFLAMAAHELKTPLTTVRLTLDAITTRLSDPRPLEDDREALQRKLHATKRQAKRISALLDVLLEVPDLLSRDLAVVRDEVDLAEVAQEVTERFAHDVRRVGTELRVHAERPVIGYWDRGRIDQLLTQLLSNAVKFGRGRPIDVDLVGDEDLATLIVRDRGIGIRAEDQQRIFERFARAASERHYGGLGLGLWVVKQIVDALGGSVEVQSRPGAGATFTVHLPRRAQAQVEPRPRLNGANAPPPADEPTASLH